MLNKPPGYICATQDSQHPTVIDIIHEPQYRQQALQIVGRLDKDTTGLVLITTDGQWNHAITSPRRHCIKQYIVSLADSITDTMVANLTKGVCLHNEPHPTLPATVEVLTSTRLRLGIQEGRYHQVKRMLAAVGNHVTALHREQIGDIVLDSHLQSGQYRLLRDREVSAFNP